MKISALGIRLRSTKFYLSTFQIEIRFVASKDEYCRAVPKGKEDLVRGVLGITTVMTPKSQAESVIIIGVFDNRLDTMLHEVVHASVKILTHHRIGFHRPRQEEVLCLLQEDMFRRIIDAARKAP